MSRSWYGRCALWLTCAALFHASGCATTQAWERETLAKPCMALDPDPGRAALHQHYLTTREGAVGGLGGGGGGCGCN